MKYLSTRGEAPVVGFSDALLAGLARDGGLYVPDSWPAVPTELPDRYADAAAVVMAPFVDGFPDFDRLVDESYATFDHPDVCPLLEIEPGLHLLELFHGPTHAFKDVALQLVGRLFDAELERRDERATILVATSGDTGSAAIEACVGRDRIDIVVLHPAGRVSEVQRRQMTTVAEANVHNLAIEGTFDDCQDLVKALFADDELRRSLSLSAMNSINWARVLPQVPYYVRAARALGPCVVSVPTGNFGNVLAAWYARRLGAPIERLVVASNRNDILTRWIETGVLETTTVVPTISPSMDIQVSSNLERLLFELLDRDGRATADLVVRFRASGRVEAPRDDVFVGARVDDDQTRAEIRRTYEATGVLVDPHTAVGLRAAAAHRDDVSELPVLCVATAHPAKFPDAVEQATGIRPPVPPRLAGVLDRPERCTTMAADVASVAAHLEATIRR